jgi:malic enzyme
VSNRDVVPAVASAVATAAAEDGVARLSRSTDASELKV